MQFSYIGCLPYRSAVLICSGSCAKERRSYTEENVLVYRGNLAWFQIPSLDTGNSPLKYAVYQARFARFALALLVSRENWAEKAEPLSWPIKWQTICKRAGKYERRRRTFKARAALQQRRAAACKWFLGTSETAAIFSLGKRCVVVRFKDAIPDKSRARFRSTLSGREICSK